ncbi:MAG: hypothetical protein SGILL_004268 [Bacillariaceae sp.]
MFNWMNLLPPTGPPVESDDSFEAQAPPKLTGTKDSDVDAATEAPPPANLKTPPVGAKVELPNEGTPQAVDNHPKLAKVTSFKFSKKDPKTGLMMEYSGVGTIVDATCAFQSVSAQNQQQKIVAGVVDDIRKECDQVYQRSVALMEASPGLSAKQAYATAMEQIESECSARESRLDSLLDNARTHEEKTNNMWLDFMKHSHIINRARLAIKPEDMKADDEEDVEAVEEDPEVSALKDGFETPSAPPKKESEMGNVPNVTPTALFGPPGFKTSPQVREEEEAR